MTVRRRAIVSCIAGVLAAAAAAAAAVPQRGENLVVNGGFEEDAASWDPFGKGFRIDRTAAHTGAASLRCDGVDMDDTHGARQVIVLGPPVRHPFRVSGWARAQDAEVGQDFDVYLDLHHDDGTPLWGQIARFRAGTHDWEYSELVFDVARPIRTIEVHVLFRRARGTVWFDDIRVELAPFEVRHEQLWVAPFGGRSLQFTATTTLPARWDAQLTGPAGVVHRTAGDTLPARVQWREPDAAPMSMGRHTLQVTFTDALRGESLTRTYPVEFDGSSRTRSCAVWVESSMRRVLPGSLPEVLPPPSSARIALAGNEYESFQVVVLPAPGVVLGEVAVEVEDLICADRHSRIPAQCIEWRQVGYVRLEKLFQHGAYPDAVPGWWPDPLLPVERARIPQGFAQPLWFTVFAPPGTPPGEYAGRVTLRLGPEETVHIPVQVTVYGFSLPVEGHMKTAFALMDGFLERVYGKPLSPELRQAYGDFVLRHRLNPDDISRTEPPAIEDLRHYRSKGLNAFNILNMVEERGNRVWVCWSPESVYTPAFKQRLQERLDPYVELLRREGLIGKAYIYTFDERGKEFYPIIREYFGMVKQRYPEVHTLTTAYIPQDPAVMRDLNVDWNCPLTAAYRFEDAERCRAAGLQVWAYICLGPRYPYANWLADDPLIEARVIWWQAFHQKLDGFLYWGLNIWDRLHNDRPIDPAAGPLLDWSITTGAPGTQYEHLHGDGELLYAGVHGPLGSIRLANIRDGLEDYEYLWLLGQAAGSLQEARQACLPVTTSLTEFTRDPATVLDQREAVARRVERARAGR